MQGGMGGVVDRPATFCRHWWAGKRKRDKGRGMTGRQRARLIVLAPAVLAGCTDPPASPTPVPPADPVPSAVSVELDQTTARVGEVITFTYRMEPALDRPVDIWTDVTTPSGESHEGGPIDFPIGETTRVYSTGYIPEVVDRHLDRPNQGRTAAR